MKKSDLVPISTLACFSFFEMNEYLDIITPQIEFDFLKIA